MYTTSSISINPTTVDYSNIISYKNLNLQLNNTGLFSLPLTNITDFNYIIYNGKLSYTSIVSHMFNETVSPSGTCSSTITPYSDIYNVGNVFNYNMTQASGNLLSSATSGIIYYEFNEPKLIYAYEIDCNSISDMTRAPYTWTFDGYNETTSGWETLDTRTAVVMTATYNDIKFTISNPTTKYKKYRLNITAVNGSASYIALTHIKLFEIYDKLESNKMIQFQFSNTNKLCLYRKNETTTNVYTVETPCSVSIADNIRNMELIVYAYIDSTGIIRFAYDSVYNIQSNINNIYMICKVYIDIDGNIDSVGSTLGNLESSGYTDFYLIKTSRTTSAIYGACSDLMNDDCLYIVDTARNHTSYAVLNDTWANRLIHPITRGAPSPNTEQVNMNSYYYFCGSAATVLTNYVYVNNTNTWTAKLNALVIAQYHTCSVLDDLYIYSSYNSSMQMYQIDMNTWTSKLNRPNSLFGSAYATSNKIIYMFGGYSTGQNSNDSYDYLNNTWQSKTNMPVNNYYAFARPASNTDIDQYCGLTARRHDIFRFNTVNNSWTSQLNVIPLGAPSSIGSSTTINNRLHTFIFSATTVERII